MGADFIFCRLEKEGAATIGGFYPPVVAGDGSEGGDDYRIVRAARRLRRINPDE